MEELKKLEATIQELDLAGQTSLQWLLLDIEKFLRRPAKALIKDVKRHMEDYQEEWIEDHART